VRFNNYINEIFDTKVNLKQKTTIRGSSYEFEVNKKKYNVDFDNLGFNSSEVYVTFSMVYHPNRGRVYDTGIASSGDEFKVFSGVIQAFNEYLKTEIPDIISFEGDLEEPSRIKLYDKFSKVMSKRFPYTLKNKKMQNYTVQYIFWHKGYK